jgi:hypothetical protein
MDYTQRHAHEFKKPDEYLNITVIKVNQPLNGLSRVIFKNMNQNRLMYLFLKTLSHTPQDLKNYILDMKPNESYDLIYETSRNFNFGFLISNPLIKIYGVHTSKKVIIHKNTKEPERLLWSYSNDSVENLNIRYETDMEIEQYEIEINDYTHRNDEEDN